MYKTGRDDQIYSLCQLKDGRLVCSSGNGSITIGDHVIKSAHIEKVNKVVILSNNRIASSSKDSTIKIWDYNSDSDLPIKTLTEHKRETTSLLYIEERDLLISGSRDSTLSVEYDNVSMCLSFYENRVYE